MVSPGAQLRAILARTEPLVLPLAYDALSAMLIEDVGFDAVGISGSSVAASLLGVPDVGILTMVEVVDQARRITSAVNLPVIADADTGYGNKLAVSRTVRELERAGVAGLFIEDQEDPKRCGHLQGKRLISCDDMVGKIRVGLSVRKNPDLVIIARTDALGVDGLKDAVERANAYAAAGADLIFVSAASSVEEVEALPRLIDAPLMMALSEGGVTPLLPYEDLAGMGYRVIAHAGTAIASAAWAVRNNLRKLKEYGTTANLMDSMMGLDERNRLLKLETYQALDDREEYSSGSS